MDKKRLSYARAGSPNSIKLNKGRACWLIWQITQTDYYSKTLIALYPEGEKYQAKEHFKSIDLEVDRDSLKDKEPQTA